MLGLDPFAVPSLVRKLAAVSAAAHRDLVHFAEMSPARLALRDGLQSLQEGVRRPGVELVHVRNNVQSHITWSTFVDLDA